MPLKASLKARLKRQETFYCPPEPPPPVTVIVTSKPTREAAIRERFGDGPEPRVEVVRLAGALPRAVCGNTGAFCDASLADGGCACHPGTGAWEADYCAETGLAAGGFEPP